MNTYHRRRRAHRTSVQRVAATAAIASLFMVAGAGAGTAQAASCFGDYCSGQDPAATGCAADAETIAVEEDVVGARLDMRWSRTCKTAWARWQQYPRGWNLGTVLLELRTVQDTGYVQSKTWPEMRGPGDNTTSWSSMVYSPNHGVKAQALLTCGGMTLLDTAFDCATQGKIETAMK